MPDREVYLKQIATGIFHAIDQTKNLEEAVSLSKIAAELKPLLDSTSLNPDLGLELLEFADLKDDSLANPEKSLEQAIAISRSALIRCWSYRDSFFVELDLNISIFRKKVYTKCALR